MIELIKSVLLVFVVIHAVETFLNDARRNRPQAAHTKLAFVIVILAWMAIKAAPTLYYGVELIERVATTA